MGTGYKRKRLPNHPLAQKSGEVLVHRQTLWDHLYPQQPNPYDTYDNCHWCGWQIPWRTIQPHQSRHSVNVDHLDTNRSNNNIDNLVVSCAWCNNNRHWLHKDPVFNMVFKVQHQQPPDKRTNPTHLATQLTGITYTKPQEPLEA